MRALRLAAYELLRFRSPMQRAGLAFLVLVPLLYGAIYLWSNWDPYSKLDQVPVAVVNEDRPVEVEDRTIDAGSDFVRELRKDPLLGWRFTGSGEAADGLRDGRYYAIITVPTDFSAKLTSGATGTPQRAAMQIRLDDANNFLVGIMAETVQSELERQISAAAVTAYFEAAFAKLAELHDGLADAANGAGDLRDGLGQAKEGSAALAAGLGDAKQGTGALANGLGTAKQGSAALAGGLGTAKQGTTALANGLGTAKQGSAALATGLGTADSGTAALAGGLGKLKQGTGELAPGAAKLSQGLHKLTGEAVPLAGKASEALPGLAKSAVALTGDAAELTSLAADVSARIARITKEIDGWLHGLIKAHPEIAKSPQYKRLQEAVKKLDGTIAQRLAELAEAFPEAAERPGYKAVVAAAEKVDAALVSRLHRLAGKHPELRSDPVYQEILKIADMIARKAARISELAAEVNGSTQKIAADARRFQKHVPELQKKLTSAATGLTALDRGGAQVASGARQVDAGVTSALTGANALHAGSGKLLTGARELDAGNGKLLTGARTLNDGSTKLLNGAQELDAGNGKLLTGARTLNDGSTKLLNGAQQLDDGNIKLLDGSRKLASGLDSAEKQIPVVGSDDRADTAKTLASPVDVKTSNAHPAGKYGRGLAPFFIAIALWVFGIVAFLMLRPVSGRILASRAGAATVAFAAWLPVLLVGVVAALVLFAVLDFALGLDPVSTAGTIGLMALGVATFSAIVHLLRLTFGAVGDALALVLLMVQLVSCGGLYPVETLPQPFRTIHDVVPMTYFVQPMRATISGGEASHVVRDATVLAGYLIIALTLLVLVVHFQRRWSMARLKPELEL